MQGLPGDFVSRLPVSLAAAVWAFYGGAKVVLLIQGWLRDRHAPAEAADTTPLAQHLDFTLTGMFDQLRRDLTRTIERAHELGQKEAANTMQRFLLELELFVKGPSDERRRRPRA